MENLIVDGIKYQKPRVVLMQDTGIGVSEVAARTCYDSFSNSEHESIQKFNDTGDIGLLDEINNIDDSEILYTLAHTYFHHSILEHANISFLVKGTSRAVLQEHARHRIQSISVRSTRYTMSSLMNAFVAAVLYGENPLLQFRELVTGLDLFVTADVEYNNIEIDAIYAKLRLQSRNLSWDVFLTKSIAKSSLPLVKEASCSNDLFTLLERGKKKRNVGDAFKHVVTDNWKVDMVFTMNVRGLKNYLGLRDSGAAFFQIRWLAEAVMNVTPSKYLDLINKKVQ